MDLRSRLSKLITVRVIVSTLLLGSAILIQLNRPGAFPVNPFFFLIGLTYGLSVVYMLSLPYAARHNWLADVQFAADAVLVSAFIFVTGGITSYFSSLYVLPIIAASTVRFRRGALQVATLSAILWGSFLLIREPAQPTKEAGRTRPWDVVQSGWFAFNATVLTLLAVLFLFAPRTALYWEFPCRSSLFDAHQGELASLLVSTLAAGSHLTALATATWIATAKCRTNSTLRKAVTLASIESTTKASSHQAPVGVSAPT